MIHTVEDQFEIAHDFLNQRISEELVAPEAREARLLRDVLSAKAGAYESTGELLTFKEHLGIYLHRTRIQCSALELEALFMSSLKGNGPIEYFLQGVDPSMPKVWAQRAIYDLDEDTVRAACRYLIRKGHAVPFSVIAEVFREYKLQWEIANYIGCLAKSEDVTVVMKLRSHKAPMVREAAGNALVQLLMPAFTECAQRLLKRGDLELLCKLFVNAASPDSIDEYRRELNARSLLNRLRAICGFTKYAPESDVRSLQNQLSLPANAKEQYARAFGVACRAATDGGTSMIRRMLEGVEGVEGRGEIQAGILDACHWKGLPVGCMELLPLFDVAPHGISRAIAENAEPRDLQRLKDFLQQHQWGPETRDVVIGFLRAGGAPEVRAVLEEIGAAKYKVEFWNVPELTSTMVKQADDSLRAWLIELSGSSEFWDYLPERPAERLPVVYFDNLYLFKRTAGVVLASLCGKSDRALLKRLIFHPYWAIQVAAAETAAKMFTSTDLDEVVAEARGRAKQAPDKGVIHGLGLCDEALYSVHCGSSPGSDAGV